jgi:hypothetical protein
MTGGWFDQVKDLFPAIEGMLTRRDALGQITFQCEFGWEREWRCVGEELDLRPMWQKILWPCPELAFPDIRAAVQNAVGDAAAPVWLIDPNWSLERIIGHLVGLASDDLTPFATR